MQSKVIDSVKHNDFEYQRNLCNRLSKIYLMIMYVERLKENLLFPLFC